MIIYASHPSAPEPSASSSPSAGERASIHALAGLELGVMAGAVTELWLLFFAWLSGWGWPGWGAVSLHITTYGVAGMIFAVAAARVGTLAAIGGGVGYALFLQWFVQHYLWHWLRALQPEQAPGWGYWIIVLLSCIAFTLIPVRARSFERDFLLK